MRWSFPIAALFAVMSLDIANVIWGYGSAAADFANFAPSLALFGVGLVLFTAHYLLLRGFYALEQNRRVFWIQCVIAATNIVAALLLVRGAHPGGDRAAAGHRLRLLLRGRRRALLRDPALRTVGGLAGAPAGPLPGAVGDRGGDQRRGGVGAARGDGPSWCPETGNCTLRSTSRWSGWSTSRSTSALPGAADHGGH